MSERREYASFLEERRAEILERIDAAARRSGRDEGEVEAIAVSKTVGPDEVLLARRGREPPAGARAQARGARGPPRDGRRAL